VNEDDPVLVEVADGVATITLNRPERRNAINGALGVGLARAVGDCEANDDVAAMILTGTDPRSAPAPTSRISPRAQPHRVAHRPRSPPG